MGDMCAALIGVEVSVQPCPYILNSGDVYAIEVVLETSQEVETLANGKSEPNTLSFALDTV